MITIDDHLTFGSENWVNQGTINVEGADVKLLGTFTLQALGNFNATGASVTLSGTLNNTGQTFTLREELGTWQLDSGTIVGGTLASADGTRLLLTSGTGTLDGVRVAPSLTVDGSKFNSTLYQNRNVLRIRNGLELDGTVLVGSQGGSVYGWVFFDGDQTVSGSGTVRLGGSTINDFRRVNSNSITVESGITIEGGTGTLAPSSPSGWLNLQAAVKVAGAGTITVPGGLDIDGESLVSVSPSSTLTISTQGNLLGSVQNPSSFAPRGNIKFDSNGSTTQMLEVMGQDLGLTATGFSHSNFSFGALTLSYSTDVQLVDLHDNAAGAGAEALYVNMLTVPVNATLDLNGLNLYTRASLIQGTVINGTIQQLPESGALTVGEFVPGAISNAGELDEWSFFGRADTSVFVVLNPGTQLSSVVPPALAPVLQYGQIELLAPDDTVLASADGMSLGELLSLNDIALPVDGVYRVRVRAASGHSSQTGNYNLVVQNATVDEFDLLLNQRTAGQLSPAFNSDAWNFNLNPGEQIRFQLLNSNAGGVLFSLQGPDGYEPFSEIADGSELITIPLDQGGRYTLTVKATGDQQASYSFMMQTFAVTDVLPNSVTAGSLNQAGDAQLFRVITTTDDPLLVQLDDSTDTGQNEIYLKRGAPPTRADYQYRFETAAADSRLLTSQLPAGEWYILVYGQEVPTPSPFTLQVASSKLHVVEVSPHQQAADQIATLEITGTGFVPGTQVTLVASGGATLAAQSISIDSFTRMTTVFDLTGLAEGAYNVRVQLPDGFVRELTDGVEVLPAGVANFQAELILPSALGRHATATIYLEYTNAGTVSMPAPLLVLESADPSDRPLLTLNQSLVASGFWSNQPVPEGFDHQVQIYASGEIPGILQPGETVRVPVYYIGLARPWDFSDEDVAFQIGIESVESTNAIDWASLEEELRPSWIDADAWPSVIANLQDQLGSTWGEYITSLGQIAQQLRKLGRDTVELADLYGFAVRQADGLNPLSQLDSSIDIALGTPGLPLTFSRSFSNTISSRYETGAFGYGWAVPWQTIVMIDADGSATVQSGGSERRFEVDQRYTGKFLSSLGDTGELVQFLDDTYELTESNGQVARFRIDGKLDYLEDPLGNRITVGYSGEQLTSLTHSNGASLTLAYSNDRISSITGSDGQIVTYTYDATFSHLLSVTTSGGITTYTYSSGNGASREHALLSIGVAAGLTRHFEYDARGWLTDTYLGANLEPVEFVYNEIGHIVATDAESARYEIYYDEQGRVARLVDANGHYSLFEYNHLGQLIRETDMLGRQRSYTWCLCGGLTSVTDELGQTSTFTLDGPNNLPTVFEDAAGNRVEFAYDAVGNLLHTTYADGTVEAYSYDGQGNLDSTTNRRSEFVTYTYNALGQVIEELRPDNSTVTYTYDAQDRLATILAPEGTTTYTWNATNQLTRVDYPDSRWVEFDYDSGGRRTRTADETGFEVNYTYDSAGRLATLTDATDGLIVTYTYDAAGRVVREDKGNGTATTYDYDAAARLTQVMHLAPDESVNAQFEYTYDTANRRATMGTLDGDWAYIYDARGQLVHAAFVSTNLDIPDQDLSYEYDALGNRVRTIIAGDTTQYNSNALNQTTSAGEIHYTYDLDGNLIEEDGPDGTKTYTYNAFNRLIQAVTPDGTWQYEYDAFGNRIAKIVDGVRTEYLLDPTGLVDVLAEYDDAGNRINSFAYGLGLEFTSSGAGDYYFDFDAIGSTAGLSGSAGTYVNEYAYQPFGGTLYSDETVANSYEFVGEYGVTNEDNGLHFMRARFYDTAQGRFVAQDPLRLDGGDFNFYRYASNNPLENIDPLGLFVTDTDPPNSSTGAECLAGELLVNVGVDKGIFVGAYAGAQIGRVYGAGIGSFLGSFFGPPGFLLGGLYGRLYGSTVGAFIGAFVGGKVGGRLGQLTGKVTM